MIDLRSDTVTKPSKEMMEFMLQCPVGDDVFEEDPTVLKLQQTLASRFGMEAALFFPSGVMCNQIAIKTHTAPMDEIICDVNAHIYNAENGGWAFHSGASIKLIQGDRGRFTVGDLQGLIQPKVDWTPNTSLICVENTVNKGGGAIWNFNDLKDIGHFAKEHQLHYHLDGARLFNALAETAQSEGDFGAIFDSISICFSKGLGAPVGSVLLGNQGFIKKARKWRKAFGGGMRQVGLLAGACLYALEHHLPKLSLDHHHARQIGEVLSTKSYIDYLYPVETNIVLFRLNERIAQDSYLQLLKEKGIWAVPFGQQQIRMVTHLDIDAGAVDKTCQMLKQLEF